MSLDLRINDWREPPFTSPRTASGFSNRQSAGAFQQSAKDRLDRTTKQQAMIGWRPKNEREQRVRIATVRFNTKGLSETIGCRSGGAPEPARGQPSPKCQCCRSQRQASECDYLSCRSISLGCNGSLRSQPYGIDSKS